MDDKPWRILVDVAPFDDKHYQWIIIDEDASIMKTGFSTSPQSAWDEACKFL